MAQSGRELLSTLSAWWRALSIWLAHEDN